jgi:hypothetical protein
LRVNSLHLPVVLTSKDVTVLLSDNARHHPCCALRKRVRKSNAQELILVVPVFVWLWSMLQYSGNNNTLLACSLVRPFTFAVIYYLVDFMKFNFVLKRQHRLTVMRSQESFLGESLGSSPVKVGVTGTGRSLIILAPRCVST